jgi:hypothetical protein
MPVLSAVLLLVACATPGRSRFPSSPNGEVALPRPAQIDSALRAELLRLGAADQAARDGFGAAMAAGDTVYLKRLMSGDSARTRRLQEIVRGQGWPTPSKVGADGAESAWLILQHSDDLRWQEALLPVLETHARDGELTPSSVALLTDRVLVRSDRPQRYGSSFSVVDGRLVAHRIEDIAGLEARRAKVGLPPMAEYVQKLGEVYKLPVEWPPKPE